MLNPADKKIFIEKEARLMEELVINYLLDSNDKKFFTKNKVFESSWFYREIFDRIRVFIEKHSDKPLKAILHSGILKNYQKYNLDRIIANKSCDNPELTVKKINYFNSLIFMYKKIDENLENVLFYDDYNDNDNKLYLKTQLQSLVKDFEERINCSSVEEGIDNSNIEEKYDQIFKTQNNSIISGIEYLDNISNGGFKSGDLVIFAARPGVGKTTLGINLVVNNFDYLRSQNKQILWVTPDMSPKYLYYRLICCRNNISMDQINNFNKSDILKYVKDLPLKVTETYVYETIAEFIRVNSENIAAVVIDYIQIIRCNGLDNKNVTRHEQIGHITIELKRLAKKYGITLFFLAQLNRSSESNIEQKVWIRDSGYLEQEADFILVLNQDRNYKYTKILFDVIKNRHGRLAKFYSTFDYSRFKIE